MIKCYAVLAAATLGGCALMHTELLDADGAYVQGAWKVGETSGVELFQTDGTYCTFAHERSERELSYGRWRAGSGVVYIVVTWATDPQLITRPDTEEFRVIKRLEGGSLLMGYACNHCEGGIAGQVYARAKMRGQCSPKLAHDA